MRKQSLMEPKTAPERGALWDHYQDVRGDSERMCAPLQTEDYCIQTMPDVSPAKWHLAHVSWFFENFLLRPLLPGYRPFHPQFGHLFNSYYETVGTFWPRPQRGLLSRPTVAAFMLINSESSCEQVAEIPMRLNSGEKLFEPKYR